LRDATLDGSRFVDTEVGKRIFAASADAPVALLEWFPQALLYGFWQSHLGKKRSQAKLARAWVSEIVGYEPAAVEPIQVRGLKGDPLNLNVEEEVGYDEDDLVETEWETTGRTASREDKKLSSVGHGQVPIPGPNQPGALAPVSF